MLNDPQDSSGWFVAGIASVVGTLASAVAFLFKLNESKNTAAICDLTKRLDASDQRHDECQRDRNDLYHKVEQLQDHVKTLERVQQTKADK